MDVVRRGRTGGTMLLMALVLVAIGALALGAGEKMSVQVKTGQLRAKASFLGALTGEVAYGTRVDVVARQGAWVKVSGSGKEGWIHESALTPKVVVMKAGDAPVGTGAGGDEVALAGKGFNSQVEEEYRKENREVDFTWVDRMEKFVISPQQAAAFLAEGSVGTEGGN
ncbi:MAG: SH3 domain-containing protein [bacterium]|nr:SH3 domain-containing protein [bacterium]